MNIGFQEILLIAIIFLILFGPNKIPQLIRSFKKAYSEFSRNLNEVKEQIKEVIEDEGNSKNCN
ncbi:MAG: twin-arginine translocase TatA/TatE family subunit [candidate division WOR-3 bacterium]|nr:twin-arginine translocase TatA/TatE family subunit [candidate division WOR-3 bacterium]MDW8151064.1 twin-arginine translocase TatA/TatE family subunit [candidate division WOR-3 bacterium]